MHTPGCNGFLHKTALYLTHYRTALSVDNSGPKLMRSYYDDTVEALASLSLGNPSFAQQCRNLYDACLLPDVLQPRVSCP